jgi:hypothetical protein
VAVDLRARRRVSTRCGEAHKHLEARGGPSYALDVPAAEWKMQLKLLALFVLATFLATAVAVNLVSRRGRGAVPDRGPSDPGARAVGEYVRGFAGTFAACADEECLAAAHARCEPSHMHRAYWTIEGTPAFMDLFVVRDGPRCVVVTFADFSRDYWGGCRVAKQTCPSVEAATGNNNDTLCSQQEVLFKAEFCTAPR